MSAHCSAWAPGGVSQRTCQSLWTDLTAPCAAARSAVAARLADTTTATASSTFMARKSCRGLKEAIISPCFESWAAPRYVLPGRIKPLRPCSGLQGQELVKHRIVAEKGSKRRPEE